MIDLEIPVVSKNFDNAIYPDFVGEKIYKFSVSDIIWAAVSVGKREQRHLWRHGIHSQMEFQWRWMMLYAFLEVKGTSIHPSRAFQALDGSEKTAISYFLGLVAAKLVAEKALGVSWLLHLDIYHDYLKYKVTPGAALRNGKPRNANQEVRPDLVGRNSSKKWFAFEAKGRSGSVDNDALVKAKEQACALQTVRGKSVELHIALQSYFRKSGLTVRWEDPPANDNSGCYLQVPDATFFERYYFPLFLFLSQSTDVSEVRGRSYLTTQLLESDITIGMDTEIVEMLRDGNAETENSWDDLANILHRYATTGNTEQRSLNQDSELSNLTIGGDGILIQLGKDMNMKKLDISDLEGFRICFDFPSKG
jgi:hypothetical protein